MIIKNILINYFFKFNYFILINFYIFFLKLLNIAYKLNMNLLYGIIYYPIYYSILK